jgi:predicted amidohydrolase YtcJ
MNPIVEIFQKGEIANKGGLDHLVELHKHDTDRLSFGGVKFVVDGSIQGYTGLLQWPYYYKTFTNGVANISQDDLNKWVLEVHKRGLQAVIHTNADEATEMALGAIEAAERQYPSVLGEEERITVAQALHAVTLGAAYLLGQDDRKGSITTGKLADFTVLDRNPLEVASPDELRSIRVLGTVMGGKAFPVAAGR